MLDDDPRDAALTRTSNYSIVISCTAIRIFCFLRIPYFQAAILKAKIS